MKIWRTDIVADADLEDTLNRLEQKSNIRIKEIIPNTSFILNNSVYPRDYKIVYAIEDGDC